MVAERDRLRRERRPRKRQRRDDRGERKQVLDHDPTLADSADVFKRAAAILAVAGLAGCGGATGGSARVYFLRGNELVAVHARADDPAAALRALATAPAGLRTSVPHTFAVEKVTVEHRVALVMLHAFADLPRDAQAQVVYTLTADRSIAAVAVAEGMPFQDWTGESLTSPATRRDYVDFTRHAPIFVSSPRRRTTTRSPVTIRGTARVFEANIVVDAWTHDRRVVHTFTTATAGAPERGRFSVTLRLPPGHVNVQLVEPDASGTNRVHFMTEVPLRVRP